MSGEIVNLRRERKRRARAEEASAAQANRARFGRDKAEQALAIAERTLAEKRVDGHRRETGDGMGLQGLPDDA